MSLGEGYNYTSWLEFGKIEFILFNVYTHDMDADGELHVADFRMIQDGYTSPPSTSASPSLAPSNLFQENTGYVIKYAGQVRTVIREPFQIDNTAELLPMDGTVSYRLCMLDEVEGDKAEFPNRMNFLINDKVHTRDNNDLRPELITAHLLSSPVN